MYNLVGIVGVVDVVRIRPVDLSSPIWPCYTYIRIGLVIRIYNFCNFPFKIWAPFPRTSIATFTPGVQYQINF